MLSKKMNALLNQQIASEAEASAYYLAMASWAQAHGYNGLSQFLYRHSDEERMHMLKLFHFVNDRGGVSEVRAVKAFKGQYKSVQEIIEQILEHEMQVTGDINKIVKACLAEHDYTTHNFLQWYLAEQIEEETLARNLLDKLRLIGSDKGGMYLFDRDLEKPLGKETS
jgi:ferritin